MPSLAPGLYRRLTGITPADDAADPVAAAEPSNGLRIVAASALQNAGDEAVNAKTVLPWLLSALGAPGWMIGLLVPIRESGSMLPQAAITPWVRARRRRKHVWVAGGLVQAAAAAAMTLAAALAGGAWAGTIVLVALAVFALGRSLTSIASKDVLGRTIPAGGRGRINGTATFVAGLVAVSVGLTVRVVGGADADVLVWLLAAAVLAWLLGAVVYAGVIEPPDEPETSEPSGNSAPDTQDPWWRRSWFLLRSDPPFRNFVIVRALLLVSALSPPFVTAMAAGADDSMIGGLGPFLIASGLAALLGGRLAGRLADRSSRWLMSAGSAASSAVIAVFLAVLTIPGAQEQALIYPAVYLLLAFTHVGVRVARKTYVIDMAQGDLRTEYVAVSNTAMGAILLATGAISSGLAALGPEVALGFLAALGLLGVVLAARLPEVGE